MLGDKMKSGTSVSLALHELNKKSHICANPTCGIEFVASGAAKYCSNACRQKAKHNRIKEGLKPRGKKRTVYMSEEDIRTFGEISSLVGWLNHYVDKDHSIVDTIKFDKSILGDEKYKQMIELLKKMEGDIFA
jgi:hypothetical protein